MTYHEFLKEWRDETKEVKCHTSGSTGTPKDIYLPKAEMARSAKRTISVFGLKEGSILHSCISPDYIGGKMMAVRAEICDGMLQWETPSNRPLENYDGEPIDLLAVVPSQMIFILDHPELWSRIRHVIIGGAPIPREIGRRIQESSIDAWETYGMTETASHIALRKVTVPEQPFATLEGIEICCDSRGCLSIHLEGWQSVNTNDIAEINADRTFRILGRIDTAIITGGKKVFPIPIEQMLEDNFGRDILITSEPDTKWGEKIVCIVSGEPVDGLPEEISDWCSECLRPEERPKEIRFGAIPCTPNGKKKRGKL